MASRFHGTRRKFQHAKFAGLCWAGALLVLLLTYWLGMVNFGIRDFWDPPYAHKHEELLARMKEYPNHPLWLVMGSSRPRDGFRPALLLDRMGGSGAPLIYNFGMGGSTLLRQLICLRRLMADGIRPQRVGIEIVGVFMSNKYDMFANDPKVIIHVRRNELDDLLGYSTDPVRVRHDWLESRINPACAYGMKVSGQTLIWRLIPIPWAWPLDRCLDKYFYDKWGWLPGWPALNSRADFLKRFEVWKNDFADSFKDFTISGSNDRALRQILELCRKEGVQPFLFEMPESDEFRALYTPQANAALESYLGKIESEYGVPMIDARTWIGWQGFSDGHHLNVEGAKTFTLRFGDELFKSAKPQAGR